MRRVRNDIRESGSFLQGTFVRQDKLKPDGSELVCEAPHTLKRKAGPSAALGMTLAGGGGWSNVSRPSRTRGRFFLGFPGLRPGLNSGTSHSGLQGRRDERLRPASRRPLRPPDSEFGKMARAGLRRPALQSLITAHLMSDLKVRPPKGPKREQRQFRPVGRALTGWIDRRCETELGLGPSCHGRVRYSVQESHITGARARAY